MQGADSHEAAGESGYKSGSLSFVKKWLRTKHAIVFRLSSGIIQINFFDHTKLIVNSPMEMVTFINKERQSNSFYMEDLAKSRHASIEELVSRLSYATDVVEHLMKSDSKV